MGGLDTLIAFHAIHLNNGALYSKPSEGMSPITNDFFAPILTVLGTQTSFAEVSTGLLHNNLGGRSSNLSDSSYVKFNLYDKDYDNRTKNDSTLGPCVCSGLNRTRSCISSFFERFSNDKRERYEEPYSMSWVISKYEFARMKSAAAREMERNARYLDFLHSKIR